MQEITLFQKTLYEGMEFLRPTLQGILGMGDKTALEVAKGIARMGLGEETSEILKDFEEGGENDI